VHVVESAKGLFAGFHEQVINVDGIDIYCKIGGEGPPLLLVHGCPQTHVMWHKMAPTLARHFTVVACDLRGYGNSSKPIGDPDHANYSFRAMAGDLVGVMAKLGYQSFFAIGHDRGARVLHRMALDHPSVLRRMVLLDILPTAFLYAQAEAGFAKAYWEWFFFIQDYDFPEKLLSSNVDAFLRYEIGSLLDKGVISREVWDQYFSALSADGAMHGMCEDYRAGATIDLVHDAADAQLRVGCPMLVLWGNHNPIWQRFDMVSVWQKYADDVTGEGVEAGHYVAEEVPEDIWNRIAPFFENAATGPNTNPRA